MTSPGAVMTYFRRSDLRSTSFEAYANRMKRVDEENGRTEQNEENGGFATSFKQSACQGKKEKKCFLPMPGSCEQFGQGSRVNVRVLVMRAWWRSLLRQQIETILSTIGIQNNNTIYRKRQLSHTLPYGTIPCVCVGITIRCVREANEEHRAPGKDATLHHTTPQARSRNNLQHDLRCFELVGLET